MQYLKSRKDEFLTKVIRNIEENLANENFSVDDLAKNVGLSRSMLHRKLKKLTGKSAGDLITQIRLEKARELLENDVGTSSEIAYRVGFNSPSYFNKVFKKHFGVSPGELRKNPADFYPEDKENNKSDASHASGVNLKGIIHKSWKFSAGIILIIVAAIVVLYLINERIKTKDIAKLEKTIAVLPFENFSTDLNDAHLGDGIANEITTQLAKIKNFKVRSFTSALQFKGDLKPSMAQIGDELKANFIVEGSVERKNEDISIHVQIIQAKKDVHIWAQEFKGNWNEIISIRTNIAKGVASTLKTMLTPEEIIKIETKPTENLEAYNFYLKGQFFMQDLGEEEQNQIQALNMYNKAIELDPQFALAYYKIAQIHMHLYWYHYDRSAIQLEKSREAIETALKIDPEQGEAYLTYGIYFYQGLLDYDKALEYFRKAKSYSPNNADCRYFIACVYRRMGDFENAKKYYREAIDLDPSIPPYYQNYGETFYLLRDYSHALNNFDSTIQLSPIYRMAYQAKARVYLNKDGNTDTAKKVLDEASLSINLSNYPELIELGTLVLLFDGKYQDAIHYLNSTNINAVEPQFYYYPRNLYYAWTYDLMNDDEKAMNYYILSRQQIEEKIQTDPKDPRYFGSLGICYAGLNQKEKAIEFGKKSTEMLPIEKEAWRGYFRLMELAQIYVMTGEYDLALEQLDFLLSVPGELSVKRLQIDFRWKPLWELDGFKELIEKYSI